MAMDGQNILEVAVLNAVDTHALSNSFHQVNFPRSNETLLPMYTWNLIRSKFIRDQTKSSII